MEITKNHLKQILKRYMIQHDIDFVNIKSSLSYDKENIKIVINEGKNTNFSLN